jgi:AraC-like DNA-binding protein
VFGDFLKMESKLEQRAAIKFCLKLGKSATETFNLVKTAYGDNALKKTQAYEWFGRFKAGRESIKDDERSGRPKDGRNEQTIAKVRDLITSDRRLTVREISLQLSLGFGTVQRILTDDLGMSRVSAKMVPKLLTDEAEKRLTTSQALLQLSEEDTDFMSKIITGDESWVYGYDPETRAQSSQWKSPSSPRPKKARMSKSNIKVMLITFFDVQGIVYHEFLEKGTTVNQYVYLNILRRLRESVRRKRPEKFKNNSWILHHDNAPSHTAASVTTYLASRNIAVLDHPPYSPDLAPNDFWLFPKLKMTLKGERFESVDVIKTNIAAKLRELKGEDFSHCFEQWKKRWHKCIQANGHYFEGDRLI